MPTRNGLAKAYHYVTTQVTLFQKYASLPRATGWIIRHYSRDKRELHINSKTSPPVCKHLSYMARKMANQVSVSLPLGLCGVWQQWGSPVIDQCSRKVRSCRGPIVQSERLWFTLTGALSRQLKNGVNLTKTQVLRAIKMATSDVPNYRRLLTRTKWEMWRNRLHSSSLPYRIWRRKVLCFL